MKLLCHVHSQSICSTFILTLQYCFTILHYLYKITVLHRILLMFIFVCVYMCVCVKLKWCGQMLHFIFVFICLVMENNCETIWSNTNFLKARIHQLNWIEICSIKKHEGHECKFTHFKLNPMQFTGFSCDKQCTREK